MDPITAAVQIAATAHEGQIRKDKTRLPYLVHPLEVMAYLQHVGCTNPLVLAAGVLHDVIEDTDYDTHTLDLALCKADLPGAHRASIIEIVLALTKAPGTPKESAHAEMIETLSNPDCPIEARGIKMADRMSNLRTLRALPWRHESKVRYATQGIDIAALANLTAETPLPPDLVWINNAAVGLERMASALLAALSQEAPPMTNTN